MSIESIRKDLKEESEEINKIINQVTEDKIHMDKAETLIDLHKTRIDILKLQLKAEGC